MLRIDETPNIKFNSVRAMQKLRPYLIAAIENAADEMVEDMKRLVHTTTYVGRTGKGAPGDPAWRSELDRDIKRLWIEMGKNTIEAAVGADNGYGNGSYSYVRAMLIAYGSGSRAHGAPGWNRHTAIHAGPTGRIVWDDDLSDQRVSGVSMNSFPGDVTRRRSYNLPLEFNQYGNDFINRAIELMETKKEMVIKRAFENLPADLFQDCFSQ